MGERVRFSPSPTGDLHLGGARTALMNALTARRTGGRFVLRIEDTDATRSERAFEDRIAEDLRWLGLRWDEGPDIGGPYSPYRQSERAELYATAVAGLARAGAAYPCFCSPEGLAADRAEDVSAGRAPRYRGPCRSLPAADAEARLAAGESHAWRFAVPTSGRIVVSDLIHGDVAFDAADMSDFVLVRSDGSVLYDLACAVDDGAMEITTVIRGDDHLPNTPRQLLLHAALGQTPPRYAHAPLVVGEDGAPLSKSAGSMAVRALREAGHLPAAVVNHLALLGWSDPDGRDVLTLDELVAAFDVSRVSPSPARHDYARMLRLERAHLRRLSLPELLDAVARFLPPVPAGIDPAEVVSLVAHDLDSPGDAARLLAGLWEPLAPDAEALEALEVPEAPDALRAALAGAGAGGEPELKERLRLAGLTAKRAMPAVRAALTGRARGLRVAALFGLLGPDEVSRRLTVALDSFDSGDGRHQ